MDKPMLPITVRKQCQQGYGSMEQPSKSRGSFHAGDDDLAASPSSQYSHGPPSPPASHHCDASSSLFHSFRRLLLTTCLTVAVALSIQSALPGGGDSQKVVHYDDDIVIAGQYDDDDDDDRRTGRHHHHYGRRTRTPPYHISQQQLIHDFAPDGDSNSFRNMKFSSHHHHHHDEHPRNPVEHYFHDQIVNHFDKNDTRRYSQRYFQDDSYWAGPAANNMHGKHDKNKASSGKSGAIFVVMGGEGAIHNTLYPFVSQHLAKRFGALTICIEHRFYGKSQPVGKKHGGRGGLVSNHDFKNLLQRKQALADAARLIQHVQDKMGCSSSSGQRRRHLHDDDHYYCPVMTIGGSYPGENAALMRIVHPDVVDMGYASSAPLALSILHQVGRDEYYDRVTQVANVASPGCAVAVHAALQQIMDESSLLSSSSSSSSRHHDLIDFAHALGICTHDMPDYIHTRHLLNQEVNFIVATRFAGYNMDYYPPGPDTTLVQACQIFQDDILTAYEKVRKVLPLGEDDSDDDDDDNVERCFDLKNDLPPGPGGRITAADWSGVGGDHSGYIWDFQSCVFCVEIGMSNASMVCYIICENHGGCCC
jgi:Serine carboxypeptidase S28